MRVLLIHDAKLPVTGYGGTERVIWSLAKGLTQQGVLVTLFAAPGTECAFADVVHSDFSGRWWEKLPYADVLHFFNTPPVVPDLPYVVTIAGNGKLGETFHKNTVFVSQNHAERHSSSSFVYNGVDPEECEYSDTKEKYLFFLGKASWRVKNLPGAIRIARRGGRELRILGGKRFLFRRWRGVVWEGNAGGKKKTSIVAHGAGLLFPVIWNEPCSVAVIEALMSGTPVLASRRGSLPEVVRSEVGVVCESEDALVDAVGELSRLRPSDCRDWAMTKFHYQKMTRDYIGKYEQVIAGRFLNEIEPVAKEPPEKIIPLH